MGGARWAIFGVACLLALCPQPAATSGAKARQQREQQQQQQQQRLASPASRLLRSGQPVVARATRGGSDATSRGSSGAAPTAAAPAAAGAGVADAKAPSTDPQRSARITCSPERDGWYPHAYPVVNESVRVCVQQVQGCGDCLFHAIAVGEVFAKQGEHIGMYHPSLEQRVAELRQLAVDTLESHADLPLVMEDGEHINGGELVETVAEQYGLKAREYLDLMRQPRVWGGGPEIIALVTAIGHPIHVYEPVCANNGTEIHLVLSGKYGSPKHDAAGAIHVLAADDKFPHCGPTEFKLHGEGGNHFLALIPVRDASDADPDREGAD